MRLACSLVLVVVLAASAAARNIYVDNEHGEDRAEGRQREADLALKGPVRSISKALRLAEPGDTIVVANTGQPYRESISLTGSRHSGSPVARFSIQGNGATLDGSAPIPPDGWQFYTGDVFMFRPARLGYQVMFINGAPAVRHPCGAGDVQLPPLRPLEWCLWRGAIYFRVENGKLPENYALSCGALATGITLYHLRGVQIDNLVVQGFAIDGINANDSARYVVLENITCQANGRSGIAVGGASQVDLNRVELSGNGTAQLFSDGQSDTQIYDSRLVEDTAQAVEQRGGTVWLDIATADALSR